MAGIGAMCWRQGLRQVERRRAFGELPLRSLGPKVDVVVLSGVWVEMSNPALGQWRRRGRSRTGVVCVRAYNLRDGRVWILTWLGRRRQSKVVKGRRLCSRRPLSRGDAVRGRQCRRRGSCCSSSSGVRRGRRSRAGLLVRIAMARRGVLRDAGVRRRWRGVHLHTLHVLLEPRLAWRTVGRSRSSGDIGGGLS